MLPAKSWNSWKMKILEGLIKQKSDLKKISSNSCGNKLGKFSYSLIGSQSGLSLANQKFFHTSFILEGLT